jgi:hypothetical protein
MTSALTDQVRVINKDAPTSLADLFSALPYIPYGLAFGSNATAGILSGAGTSASRTQLGTAAGNALSFYLNAANTSGDMRGIYMNMHFSGANGSGETARFYSIVNNVTAALGGTVNGAHISLDFVGANAKISGAGNALRATFGISDPLATDVGGTCACVQFDSFFDTAINIPSTFAFMRFTDTGVGRGANLMNVPNAANGTIFAAHTTEVMSHSIKIISANGTAYYVMCTNDATHRS